MIDELMPLCRKQPLDDINEFITDPANSIIRTQFDRTVRDLISAKDFPNLKDELIINRDNWRYDTDQNGMKTSDNVSNEPLTNPKWSTFTLPTDFIRVVRSSPTYNDSTLTTGINVSSQADWELSSRYGYDWFDRFRLRKADNEIDIQPGLLNTTNDMRFIFYISNNWLEHTGTKLNQYTFINNPNEINGDAISRLPSDLIVDGTAGRYLGIQGWTEQAAYYMQQYNTKIENFFQEEEPNLEFDIGIEGVIANEPRHNRGVPSYPPYYFGDISNGVR